MSPRRDGIAEKPDGADVVLTSAEVAAWLKIKPRQVERFGIPCVRLGHKTVRYIKGDVLTWFASQRSRRGGAA